MTFGDADYRALTRMVQLFEAAHKKASTSIISHAAAMRSFSHRLAGRYAKLALRGEIAPAKLLKIEAEAKRTESYVVREARAMKIPGLSVSFNTDPRGAPIVLRYLGDEYRF